jgi:ATP-dependent protease ClpP protease subunit
MTAQEAMEYGIVDQVITKENRSLAPANSPTL